MSKKSLKDSLQLNKPRRTPNHPTKSHVVKINDNGTERLIRFGQQGVSTAGKPKKLAPRRSSSGGSGIGLRHKLLNGKAQCPLLTVLDRT